VETTRVTAVVAAGVSWDGTFLSEALVVVVDTGVKKAIERITSTAMTRTAPQHPSIIHSRVDRFFIGLPGCGSSVWGIIGCIETDPELSVAIDNESGNFIPQFEQNFALSSARGIPHFGQNFAISLYSPSYFE
jgi:hypothetical protein